MQEIVKIRLSTQHSMCCLLEIWVHASLARQNWGWFCFPYVFFTREQVLSTSLFQVTEEHQHFQLIFLERGGILFYLKKYSRNPVLFYS